MSTTEEKMQFAVNQAIVEAQQIITRARAAGFATPLDQKRSAAWREYGYPEAITPTMLYNLWARGGYANGAVDKIVSTCWATNPQVVEGRDDSASTTNMTTWDKKAAEVLNPRFWHAFAEADRRRLVCRWSAIILRIADNLALDKPAGSGALVEAVPVWCTALEVKDRDAKTGAVKMWQYTSQQVVGSGTIVQSVHPSRVFILGDATAGAVGFLDPVYNNFINLEKISGGAGESFLKNAARQMHLNFEREVSIENIAKMYGVKVDELKNKFDQAARDLNIANDLLLITQGASVNPMVAAVESPKDAIETNLWEISSGTGIPQKILVGNQTGERASTEDQKQHNARCQSRRVGQLSFDISDLVAKLQEIKVLPVSGPLRVLWDNLTIPTAADRLENAWKMSQINEKFEHTGEQCFTLDETRVAAGYEPKAVTNG